MYVNTVVLKKDDCRVEVLSEGEPTGVTYDAEKHACLLADCGASCEVWIFFKDEFLTKKSPDQFAQI